LDFGKEADAVQEVELKEWQNGRLSELLLEIPAEGDWNEAMGRVDARLEENKHNAAFRIAQVTIHVGVRPVTQEQLHSLVEGLRAYGLLPVAVVATESMTQQAARNLVLNTYSILPGSASEITQLDIAAGNNALYVPGTVRSGQRIVHRGNVVIGGDVNPGSEVFAEGDILIFGTLRGVAHAGSAGNERARIVAGNMRPPQLRIAHLIARAPEDTVATGIRNAEVAFVRDGQIEVEKI